MKKSIIFISAVAIATFNSFAQPPNLPGAGNCLSYNGTSDYVEMANEANFDLTQFSLEAWINLSTINSNAKFIISKYQDGGVGDASYRLQVNEQNQLQVCVLNSSGSGSYIGKNTNTALLSNIWYHVVGTYDGGTTLASLKLYINGIEITNVNTFSWGIFPGVINNWQPLRIGAASMLGTPSYFFPGQIDEVRIWNRALTQTEIRNTLCQKLVGNEAGLVGYWRFDEESGTTAYDSSPYGNHGTLK